MNAMVSARVPVEIKRQGDCKLKELGSSATELVNAAYLYVIKHGALPGVQMPVVQDKPQVKTLSGDAAKAFKAQWDKRSVLEAKEYDGHNFKDLLDEARGDYYARFA